MSICKICTEGNLIAVECKECKEDEQLMCAECDRLEHRHPKRQNHRRTQICKICSHLPGVRYVKFVCRDCKEEEQLMCAECDAALHRPVACKSHVRSPILRQAEPHQCQSAMPSASCSTVPPSKQNLTPGQKDMAAAFLAHRQAMPIAIPVVAATPHVILENLNKPLARWSSLQLETFLAAREQRAMAFGVPERDDVPLHVYQNFTPVGVTTCKIFRDSRLIALEMENQTREHKHANDFVELLADVNRLLVEPVCAMANLPRGVVGEITFGVQDNGNIKGVQFDGTRDEFAEAFRVFVVDEISSKLRGLDLRQLAFDVATVKKAIKYDSGLYLARIRVTGCATAAHCVTLDGDAWYRDIGFYGGMVTPSTLRVAPDVLMAWFEHDNRAGAGAA